MYSKIWDLADVVIPTKEDKGGRRFGFARFDQVYAIQFEYERDWIIIGINNFSVNLSRFHRMKDRKGNGGCNIIENRQQIINIDKKEEHADKRVKSYSQVLHKEPENEVLSRVGIEMLLWIRKRLKVIWTDWRKPLLVRLTIQDRHIISWSSFILRGISE